MTTNGPRGRWFVMLRIRYQIHAQVTLINHLLTVYLCCASNGKIKIFAFTLYNDIRNRCLSKVKTLTTYQQKMLSTENTRTLYT